MSLLMTAKAAGVHPNDYFRGVLLRISTCTDAKMLKPHGWKQDFEAEVNAAARRSSSTSTVPAQTRHRAVRPRAGARDLVGVSGCPDDTRLGQASAKDRPLAWVSFPVSAHASSANGHIIASLSSGVPRGPGRSPSSTPARPSASIPRGTPSERHLLAAGRGGARDVHFTPRVGHSSQGHPFGTTLDPAAKRDLIEYLKTL